jgi:hypothetical protein
MRALAIIVGIGLLALALTDVFNTLVLARRTRHVFRIARAYYRYTWEPFAAIAKYITSPLRREGFLGVYGPGSLLLLLGLWSVSLIFAFAMLQWAAHMKPAGLESSFLTDLYFSATTLFTLSTGDPENATSRIIAVIEGGIGLGCLGLVVGYLPVLYQSFSARELTITLMDARAGSPPSAGSLLENITSATRLEQQLATWETWTAQVLENHLSFPMLAYFRSQHPNQSWLTALVAIADLSAVAAVSAGGALRRQAELTLAMTRHALADVTVVFALEENSTQVRDRERLSKERYRVLRRRAASNPALQRANQLSYPALAQKRAMYEPLAFALSEYFLMSLPDWLGDDASRHNWSVPVTERDEAPFAVSDPFSQPPSSKAS